MVLFLLLLTQIQGFKATEYSLESQRSFPQIADSVFLRHANGRILVLLLFYPFIRYSVQREDSLLANKGYDILDLCFRISLLPSFIEMRKSCISPSPLSPSLQRPRQLELLFLCTLGVESSLISSWDELLPNLLSNLSSLKVDSVQAGFWEVE
ncbi:hypothetical protein BDV12DRAFT_180916 [Aspergillus spectabilis]